MKQAEFCRFVIQHDGSTTPLMAITDHQDTIVGLVDATGTWQFDATYDAWGRQTVAKNSIGFQRGYTGHEMLPEYGLINMRSARRDALLAKNGRLYDPLLGRFLSPDRSALCDAFVTTWRKNYVQQPDNSQNFNGYSYCLNNPLKYTDSDGEFLHLIFGAIIGGTVNWATHGCKFNAKGLGYFGVGALAGAAIGGVAGGIDAITDGRNFMHGGRITDDVSIEMPFMEQGGEYDCRYEVFRSNDMYFNGKTLRVSELRQLYPNVEIDDLQMAKMYGKIGSLAIERIPVSDLSKTDIAKAMIDNVAQRHTIIYEMKIK